ncbi:hypothetical protein, partial [Oenococcus oeni]|uniref:hypothetical protein n=1 Tax=Oenococcus oeni TaxID=1247 RepID=UPI001C5B650B
PIDLTKVSPLFYKIFGLVSNGILPERRTRITNEITKLFGITMLITVWRFGNESSQKAIK